MSTGYASGMRWHVVTILNREEAASSKFGLDGAGITWQEAGTVHAAIDFSRGMRALSAGAIDAYAVVIVRMNYNDIVTMRSRIVYDGVTYQILPETFHADRRENKIQFNAQAIVE